MMRILMTTMMKMMTAMLATGTMMRIMMTRTIGETKTIMRTQVTMTKTSTMKMTKMNTTVEEVTVAARADRVAEDRAPGEDLQAWTQNNNAG
jgi:hypothetical protein